MQSLSLCCMFAAALSGLLMLPMYLAAAKEGKDFDQANLQTSAAASLAWLSLIDKGQYEKSWDDASSILKMTVPKDDWIAILNRMRKPYGAAKSRQVLDQRVAKNPQGLPEGDYIVMFYKTDFASKADGHELVTLYLEDGKWRVLTYQVN